MDELVVETTEKPQVQIDCTGNLIVSGWERSQIAAQAPDKDRLSLKQEEDQVQIGCQDDCRIQVPLGAEVHIRTVSGQAILKNVRGPLKVDQCSAGLSLNQTGAAEISFVGGNLVASQVQGSLTVQQAAGNASLKEIHGNVSADFVGGHLNVNTVFGNLQAVANGNAHLEIDPQPGSASSVEAHGVLTCRLPAKADASLTLLGYGPVAIRLPDRNTSAATAQEETIVLGDGSAQVRLIAHGPLSVQAAELAESEKEFRFDFDMDFAGGLADMGSEFADQIHDQLASQMEALEQQLESSVARFSTLVDTWGASGEAADRLNQRMQAKIERAQEKIRRAQERAARKVEQAQRRAARQQRREKIKGRASFGGRSWNFDMGSVRRSSARQEPVSEEERMAILNMLAEKKISIEEAEQLLAALEGDA